MKALILFFIAIGIHLKLVAQHDDCANALLICTKDRLVIDSINSVGIEKNEAVGTCLAGGAGAAWDSYTKWLYWKAATNGSLTFIINVKSDTDIDFALFELPNGIVECQSKKLLRCNATSPPCAYSTGLNLTDTDTVENFNCDVGENGFCKYIDMKKGQYYALYISNFTQSLLPVVIDWGGTGLFEDVCANEVRDNSIHELELFPNPVEDELVFEHTNWDLRSVIHFTILNVDSKVCAKFDKPANKRINIDVQKLSPGMYFLHYRDGANHRKIFRFLKY